MRGGGGVCLVALCWRRKSFVASRAAIAGQEKCVTVLLTMVTLSITFHESLAHEGRLREIDLQAGARAVPAGGVMTRTQAALGIMRDATTSAPWGASTGLGQVGAGNARSNCVRFCLRKGDRYRPALRPRPRKPGLEPRAFGRKSVAQSREWNADRRARPQRRVGASRPLRGAPRTRWCGQSHLRLSAFRFLLFFFHPAPRKWARGTTRRVVEGASDSTTLFRRQRRDESDAPSTAQVRGPPPPLSGGG